MSQDRPDSMKDDAIRIHERYNDIIEDFDKLNMLTAVEFKKTALKDGLVMKSAKNAEFILIYICKKSKIPVVPKPPRFGNPVFSDYIHWAHLRNAISDKAKSEFEHIRNIRNSSAHTNEYEELNLQHEELSVHKAGLVEDSIKYITDWFFKVYLEDQYPELSPKKKIAFDENTTYIKRTQADVVPEKKDEAIIPKEKQIVSPKSKNKSKRWIFLLLLIALVFGSYFVYSYTDLITDHKPVSINYIPSVPSSAIPVAPSNSSNLTEKQKNSEKELKETVKNFLDNYYTSIGEDNFDAKNYFSEDVKEYQSIVDDEAIPVCGIAEINSKLKELKDFYNPDFVFHAENLELLNTNEDEETVWQYKGQYSDFRANCKYRPSQKVLILFTLDYENKKFVSLSETVLGKNEGGS